MTPVQQDQKSADPTKEAQVEIGPPESIAPASEASAERATAATLAYYLTSPVTVIIGFNIIVFILMAVSTHGLPSGVAAIRFGSNFTPLTLSGDWWRLITQNFIHFGVIHILLNTLALAQMGYISEFWLGRVGLIGAYIATGVCAGVTSLLWHSEGVNSAGASGAIFGLAGINLGLVANGAIGAENRAELLKYFGQFILFGLFYGMQSGVDNAAHFGGLVSGILFSLIYLWAFVESADMRSRRALCGIFMPVIALGGAAIFLRLNTKSLPEREAVLNELQKIEAAAKTKAKDSPQVTP